MKSTRYIVVTGGVLSGSGKGITAASLGACLQARGLTVNLQKFDMYLNVDAGLLNPGQHGEVFVTADGGETDLDIGHYERFLNRNLAKLNSVMAGQIFSEVIAKERAGLYQGQDVQVIPHVTSLIQDKILAAGVGYDVLIIELGGTVGDYEGLAFLEAVRQLPARVGPGLVFYSHIVYLPYLSTSAEIKTKPAQNACRDLRGIGINPDLIIGRSQRPVPESARQKLSLFGGLPLEAVGIIPDAETVYEVPLILEDQGVGPRIAHWLGVKRRPRLGPWRQLTRLARSSFSKKVKIGLIAKYLDNRDTYLSVTESLKSAAWLNRVNLDLVWVDAAKLSQMTPSSVALELMPYDGLLVPGGFGDRAIEGMIRSASFALTNNTPYLGICLGMQLGVVAFSRLVGLKRAHSAEFAGAEDQLVIDYLPGQRSKSQTGATMRLGSYPCRIKAGTKTAAVYQGQKQIDRRHRHRLEFNSHYRPVLTKAGLVLSGICPDNKLVEIIEVADLDFFVGCQFHPEFESRPAAPEALFVGLIAAAKARQST